MANPSLVIAPDRFKASKLYSQIPQDGSGDFVVTRATTAYRTNQSGILESVANNVPRLDYPASGGCPALLVEPAATNLLLRSEEFDDAAWTKTRSTITPNATSAPNGANTADAFFETIDNGSHIIFSTTSITSGTIYTGSYFVKPNGRQWVQIAGGSDLGGGAAGAYVNFDLLNGVVGSSGGGVTGTITPAGNGFWRITATRAASGTGSSGWLICSLQDNTASRLPSFVGDTSLGYFLYGAQLETGSVATSYIPTVATTQTRNADVISLTGVSSLIGQTEGTLYAEVDFRNISFSNPRTIFGVSDGTWTNGVFLILDNPSAANNQWSVYVRTSGVTVASIRGANLTSSNFGTNKIAAAYSNNDFVLYVNGVQIGTDTLGGVPIGLSSVNLGGAISGLATSIPFNDRIRAAALYKTRLSNAELQSLTL